MGLFKLDMDAIEGYMSGHLRVFIVLATALLAFVGIVAATVFFVHVRGAEQTMVPDVVGRELTAALLELQVKELYPRINLRYSQSSADRGLILEQTPHPGSIVKAGRRINLVVSRGVMLNTVENYVGRNVDDVRMDVMTLFSGAGVSTGAGPIQQLITLREPFMFVYSSEPPGTVLQQNPVPGTSISGPIVMELVVSRGPEHAMTMLPNFIGLGLDDVLEQIGRIGIDFEFSLRSAQNGETPGTVVGQVPEGNTLIPSGTRVAITMAFPDLDLMPDNEVFGLFSFDMARNPYPLLVRLDSIHPNGDRHRLLSVQYPGGRLTIPYRQPVGAVLVLSMLNREIHRETVTHASAIQLTGRF